MYSGVRERVHCDKWVKIMKNIYFSLTNQIGYILHANDNQQYSESNAKLNEIKQTIL